MQRVDGGIKKAKEKGQRVKGKGWHANAMQRVKGKGWHANGKGWHAKGKELNG